MCAGVTPSATSFQLLAEVVRTTPSTDRLRQVTDQYLQAYSDLANISVLQQVLSGEPTGQATALAAKKLEIAIERHLTAAQGDGRPQPYGVANNAAYFRPFVSILESLTLSPDGEVATQASETLSDLRGHLSASPVPEPPPAQASTQQ